jgi:mRNA-degrading endonuclease toxin of MazEF toxin-antitoxin module
MEINQYEIYLINLDPSVGHEIKKTPPPSLLLSLFLSV